MMTTRRLLNDEEFEAFAEEACNETWMAILEMVLRDSNYGPFGISGIPYTYSSEAAKHELGSEEFPELTPDQRAYWSYPSHCDWIVPVYMLIARDVFPDYEFKCYQLFEEGAWGHQECVGIDPDTGDIVVFGTNILDAEETLAKCGYPDTEYVGAQDELEGYLEESVKYGAGMQKHWGTMYTDSEIDIPEND